eukprot:jgi/Phyca11/504475/fgenesh2_kg.PHYCAscaffold_8_\
MERNIVIKNNNNANGSNNTEEADFTKRAPPPTPMHPAMLFDRPNSNSSTTRGNNNDEMPPMATPSTVNLNQAANSTRPGERSAGYYEAQERMRKLLLKSYHTQQQLATGGSQ